MFLPYFNEFHELVWIFRTEMLSPVMKLPVTSFQPGEEQFPKLENLPEECIREVLLRLADHKDLENSARACDVMKHVVDEQRIWRELVQFHFTSQQIEHLLGQNLEHDMSHDWQLIYHKLRKWVGLAGGGLPKKRWNF